MIFQKHAEDYFSPSQTPELGVDDSVSLHGGSLLSFSVVFCVSRLYLPFQLLFVTIFSTM